MMIFVFISISVMESYVRPSPYSLSSQIKMIETYEKWSRWGDDRICPNALANQISAALPLGSEKI